MEHFFCVNSPDYKASFEMELEQCLDSLVRSNHPDLQLIKLVVFIQASNNIEYQSYYNLVSKSIKAKWGNKCPTFSILAESPLNGYKIQIEAIWVSNVCNVHYSVFNNIPVVEVVYPNRASELWAAVSSSLDHEKGLMESSNAAFEEMHALLSHKKFNFNQVVRQWNYVPNILKSCSQEKELQNYQIFNEVRNYYYSRFRTNDSFPAATGIGTSCGPMWIEFCAFSEELSSYPVSNPQQSDPHQYGQLVLKGKLLPGKEKKQPPQFERARLILSKELSLAYVSGTASIKGELTWGIDDVALQTRTTISLLEQLTSIDNLNKNLQKQRITNAQWRFLRVYIKNRSDFSIVSKICLDYFGDKLAISFVEADICRDNLLVEIEGEMSITSTFDGTDKMKNK